ncbi:MAG: right-handed parallel beta-helix repeat-containing protein [Blastocatellia bacterium]
MSRNSIAFMSYVRLDDQHEGGRLTQFRERLSGEVRMQTGESFEIFQDRNDITWGQQWKQRIEDSLDEVTFLIPIITPGFFKSPPCREEFERFLNRQKALGRTDLILPVYYVECATLSDEAKREHDSLAKVIAARQYADWRELRFEPFTSPQVGKMLAKMAQQIVEALERSQAVSSRSDTAAADTATIGAIQPTGAQVGKAQEETQSNTSGAARGPVPKSEPPTVVVDALHRGDYATLTEALKEAKPGTRILVRPGLYKEGVLIDKPIEIVGDGERDDIVIEASGKDAVLFQANMGRITNLTLRQAGGGEWYCVDIAQGRLDLEECDILSQSLACVAIHGGADPRLRRNRIHDGKQMGVFVYENGQGTLEDNDIFANAFAGVEIKEGGNPTLRHNRIHDGKQSGVFVHKNGQGTLEDNDIFANARAGVEIREGGNPTLRHNRIHDGKQVGVFVNDNGQGTLEDNDIFANALAGVEIREGSNPTLRQNRIHGGKQVGVYVYENGQGTLEDNDIFANALAGVWIQEGGHPTLRYNRVCKNKGQGIRVVEGGGGVFEGNDLRENAGGAWDIAAGSKSKVQRIDNIE